MYNSENKTTSKQEINKILDISHILLNTLFLQKVTNKIENLQKMCDFSFAFTFGNSGN